jgi:hypothetical protein
MQEEAEKLIVSEDEKVKTGSGVEDLNQKISYTKEEVSNHIVEYNIIVLYSYMKNYGLAIEKAVKLLCDIDSSKDSFLYFKTAFLLIVLLLISLEHTY